jgi:uncharacterized protein YbcI
LKTKAKVEFDKAVSRLSNAFFSAFPIANRVSFFLDKWKRSLLDDNWSKAEDTQAQVKAGHWQIRTWRLQKMRTLASQDYSRYLFA